MDSTYAALIRAEYQSYIIILVVFGSVVLAMVAATWIALHNLITRKWKSFALIWDAKYGYSGSDRARRDRDGLV